jgi:hypothetical protein
MKTCRALRLRPLAEGDERLTPAHSTSKAQLLAMLAGGGLDGVEHKGDPGALQQLLGVLETPCHLRDRDAIGPTAATAKPELARIASS